MSFVVAGNAFSSPVDRADFWERRGGTVAWSFVALGVAVRLVRYLLRFPLWGDEMMLAENLLTRDYAGLAGGLDHWQVAPLGYLWAQKAVVSAFGFNEYSLRAVALVGGIGALVLFRIAAGHLLRGLPLVLAVAFLATAYYPIRHAAEVKPYAVDLLAAVLLIEPFLAWLHDPARITPLGRLVVVAPFAVAFSFPAVLVGGGVSLALAIEACRQKAKPVAGPWLAFNAALGGTFLLLFFSVMRSHYATNGAIMGNYWESGFPPSPAEPLRLLTWFASAHSGEGIAYPVGGERGGSTLQLLLAICGAVVLRRTPRRGVLYVVVATAGLGLLAAALQRYPYGHGERLQQYWGPLLCLLIGQGAATALWSIRAESLRRHAVRGVLTATILLGGGILFRDLTHPYKLAHDADHRAFSRWFWSQAAAGEPLVDLEEDLATPVFDSFEALPYRVYKRIYDRRPAPSVERRATETGGATAEGIERLPAGTPVRCVAFARHGKAPDAEKYEAWLARMNGSYHLVEERRYPVQIEVTGETATYHVWRFEPKTPAAHLRTALPTTVTQLR